MLKPWIVTWTVGSLLFSKKSHAEATTREKPFVPGAGKESLCLYRTSKWPKANHTLQPNRGTDLPAGNTLIVHVPTLK